MSRLILICLSLFAFMGSAQAQMKPEDSIKYRKAAFSLLGYNFGNLAGMAQEKRPYSKADAIKFAEAADKLSAMPYDFFQAGTDKGETKAKANIWTEMDKFNGGAKKMQEEIAKLAAVAKSGDLAALKAQVGETGKTCKGCHDAYKNQ
jgi:cytochrome c556